MPVADADDITVGHCSRRQWVMPRGGAEEGVGDTASADLAPEAQRCEVQEVRTADVHVAIVEQAELQQQRRMLITRSGARAGAAAATSAYWYRV